MTFVTAAYILATLVSWGVFSSRLLTGALAVASGFLLMWTVDLVNRAAGDEPP